MKNLICVLVLLIFASILVAQTAWPNEPAISTLLSDFNFDTKAGSGWTPTYPGGGTIVAENTAPASPANVLQHTWNHSGTGNDAQPRFAFPSGTREFYVGFWWRPSNPFYGWQGNDLQKIALIEDDHTYIGMKSPRGCLGGCGPYHIGLYMDLRNDNRHIYTNGWGEGECCNNNVSNPDIILGQWHLVEIYGRTSTTESSQDGVYRLWMDRQLIVNYANVNFWNRTFSQLLLTSIWDHGDPCVVNGQSCADYHQYDHVRVSIPNGAPAPFFISTSSLPSAQSGKPYSATLQASGGKTPYSWTISSGNLLPELSLNKSTGVISGVPTTAGKCTFTAKVMDASVPAKELTKSYSIIASGTSEVASRSPKSTNGNRIGISSRAGAVAFQMPQGGEYKISVFDLSGSEIWRHVGTGEAVWNHGGELQRGVYVLRAEQNDRTLKASYCHIY